MNNNNQTTSSLPSPPTKTPWIDSDGNLLKASKDWVNHVYQAITRQQGASDNLASLSSQTSAISILSYLKSGVAPTPVVNFPIKTVLDYGAVGNGTADDSAAFNAAATAASSGSFAVYIPSGYNFLLSAPVNMGANVWFFGSGNDSLVTRGATLSAGKGLFNINGSNCGLCNFRIEGAVTTPTGINQQSFGGPPINGDPMATVLTQNTSIWVHSGANNISFFDMFVEHTGGYSVLLDATTANINQVNIQQCTFQNNRPSLFGGTGVVNTSGTSVTWVSGEKFFASMAGTAIVINGVTYTVASYSSATSITLTSSAGTQSNKTYTNYAYPAWNGGIHYQGGDTGGHYRLSNLLVSDCTFLRSTGNQIWGHLYSYTALHSNINVVGNTFEDIGIDCVQIAGTTTGSVVGNSGRRVGYICSNDTSASKPWLNQSTYAPSPYGVFLDTSGCESFIYSGNSVTSVYGGGIDLDGFANGNITGNVVRTPSASDPEYVPDQISSWLANISYGVNFGATNYTLGGQNVSVTENTFVNLGYGAIRMFGARNCQIEGNNIIHPNSGYTIPPIVIANVSYASSSTVYAYNNNVLSNRITWSPSSASAAIVESESITGIVWTAGQANWVSGNHLFRAGATPGVWEFSKAASTSSTTQLQIATQVSAPTANGAINLVRYTATDGSGGYTVFQNDATGVNAAYVFDSKVIATDLFNSKADVDGGNAFQTSTSTMYITGSGNGYFQSVNSNYAGLTAQAGPPSSPSSSYAYIYYDSTIGALRYNLGGAGWVSIATSSPGGSNTYVQYNNSGTFGGDANFTWNSSTKVLTVTGTAATTTIKATNGYINSDGGFYTPSSAYTAVNVPNGGVYANTFYTPSSALNAVNVPNGGVYSNTTQCNSAGLLNQVSATTGSAGEAVLSATSANVFVSLNGGAANALATQSYVTSQGYITSSYSGSLSSLTSVTTSGAVTASIYDISGGYYGQSVNVSTGTQTMYFQGGILYAVTTP